MATAGSRNPEKGTQRSRQWAYGPCLRGCNAGQNRSSRLNEGVSLMGYDSLGLYPEREEQRRDMSDSHYNRFLN